MYLGDKKALLDKASAIMSKMNDAADVDDADAADDEVDEDEEELTKEIFLELTGGKDKISVQVWRINDTLYTLYTL